VARNVAKLAAQRDGAPLDSAEWEAYFRFAAQPRTQAMKRMLRALPAEPRCGFCGAPFAGIGARIVAPFGYRPSRKNPTVCSVCVESAPPGGTTGEVGVLFADLRGFTALSETLSPERSSAVLRRFYAHAEKVLLPKAMIDKLIGDEVMALYIPVYLRPGAFDIVDADRRYAASVMVEHARELLTRVGYGSPDGPEFDLGIGLDFGEAFIGNIGDEFVRDFTAVGDVVNTAARLQSQAAGGEIVLSARLGQFLAEPPGELEHLQVKGKSEPVRAYRIVVD
jgi:adenylate cyclase